VGRTTAGAAYTGALGDVTATVAHGGDEGDHVVAVDDYFLARRGKTSIRRVWSDTFLHAEQQHLLRLLLWAALSIFAATTIAVTIAVRRTSSALLSHFALQMALWGSVIGAIAAIEWHGLHLRDISGAARVERLLWMNIGFDTGFVGMGCVLALCGRILVRNAAAVGAGTGILVQGLGLLLIDLQFASMISR
jgi:hypothetical protein